MADPLLEARDEGFDEGFAAGIEHARVGKRARRKPKMTKAEKVRRVQAYQRARHARLLADPTVVEHGVYTTYNGWGCSCEPCKEAWRVYYRAYLARRRTAVALTNRQKDTT